MALIVKKVVYEKASEGLHNIVVTAVEDLGQVETKYGTKPFVLIKFAAQDQKDKEGKPIEIHQRFPQSLNAKSNLMKFLGQLGYTNVGTSFDLEEIIGTKMQVVIEHNEKDGETYANIASVIKQKKAKAEEF